MTWRLLPLGTFNAFLNMAIDEAVLTAKINGGVPNTLRFYTWKPSAVSIGRFQTLTAEVDLRGCKDCGVEVVRRISGGGAVYHGENDELTYSLVIDKYDLGTDDIGEMYSRIYVGLAEALRLLGVEADYSAGGTKTCPNLTVKGRKISGSSQCHRSGVVLQHGTVLLNVDLVKMFTVLRVPWSTACYEVARFAKNRITSVSEEVGRSVGLHAVSSAIVTGFEKAFNVKFETSDLTLHEQQQAQILSTKRYSSGEWNIDARTSLGDT